MAAGSSSDLKYFHPWQDIEKSGARLPHWQQPGASYFITFSMADAVPSELQQSLNEQRQAWEKHHPKPWDEASSEEFHKRFSGARERWLDSGYGSCFLKSQAPRKVVIDALRHFNGKRYALHCAVVMPNHAHAIITLHPEQKLDTLLHSWKSFTAHEITKNYTDAPNPFWQADYFDRLIRDQKHFQNCTRYIRKNPGKANLRTTEFELYESQLAQGIT